MTRQTCNDSTTSYAIYDRLKNKVMSYEFSPSQQLQPWTLADEFKVSSTPVREALIRLGAEGLVAVMPNKGFFMKPLNPSEICSLYVLRSQLLRYSLRYLLEQSRFSDHRSFVTVWEERLSDLSASSCALIEEFFMDWVDVSRAQACVDTLQNTNERTRFIRCLFTEEPARSRRYLGILRDLVRHIKRSNADDAIDCLITELDFKVTSVPALCNEGLVRSFRN
ncbi:transcriptional regulatory protein (plasmid) [Allorhizobium ampelinum S4]|uniref:Transcriptional regulatory protein n=1 Tax=Allorhizobium ampelinum (strain ATCC BAA-846 / DSM 112012 / S4) TaxID=311402 RepID=B9K384_ALLAM|nr:GntR family transcriptional regulator [Allorhizobium ampelinum]ACM39332.1 transcriptional regulatory protein [Allorhizobium ampelinum S4]